MQNFELQQKSQQLETTDYQKTDETITDPILQFYEMSIRQIQSHKQKYLTSTKSKNISQISFDSNDEKPYQSKIKIELNTYLSSRQQNIKNTLIEVKKSWEFPVKKITSQYIYGKFPIRSMSAPVELIYLQKYEINPIHFAILNTPIQSFDNCPKSIVLKMDNNQKEVHIGVCWRNEVVGKNFKFNPPKKQGMYMFRGINIQAQKFLQEDDGDFYYKQGDEVRFFYNPLKKQIAICNISSQESSESVIKKYENQEGNPLQLCVGMVSFNVGIEVSVTKS